MVDVFEIRNQEDLFSAIRLIRTDDWPSGQLPQFVDWPRYQVTVCGSNFGGGVPTRIMPAILDLQRTIRRAHARALEKSPRGLTKYESSQTELVVYLAPGSTTFLSNLEKPLNAILGGMTGRQKMLTVLGATTLLCGAYVWAAHINSRAELREIDLQIEMSRSEREKWGIVTDLVRRLPDVHAFSQDVEQNQIEWMRQLRGDDRLLVEGSEIVDGATAQQLIRSGPPPMVVADRLDSVFRILSVDSGSVENGFRARVEDVVSGEKLPVTIPAGTLQADQVVTLQKGEWEKRQLHLSLNIERTEDGRIKTATLISAGLAEIDAVAATEPAS